MKTPVMERFLGLVIHDTQSDYDSDTSPTTAKQIEFAKFLVEECKSIGLSGVSADKFGYVTATLPATDENISAPVIGFFAHMDTSPDFSGEGVSPQIFYNYDGKDIILSEGCVLSPAEFPELHNHVGHTLITTSGKTLLGADDKAGISEILSAMEYLIQHPEIPHGKIRIAFTTDEEVGRGVVNFDVKAFGADFAYTVDGGRAGELELENFNAARAKFEITGKSVHPGSAKGVMINAAIIAAELVSAFPPDDIPANSEGREGFYHLGSIAANVESAKIDYRIRCFDEREFARRKAFAAEQAERLNEKYGAGTVKADIHDEYLNMQKQINERPQVLELAKKAYAAAGLEVVEKPIRGGTDGSQLSYKGLPCPNIFSGGHNFHGPYEFIALEEMEKAVEVIVNICRLGGGE